MPSVAFSEDLKRVCMLPRREISRDIAEEDARRLTPLLTTAEGKRAGAHLLPWQGFCIREFYENEGGYFQLPVGNGKTLFTYLAAYIAEATRPALIVPSSLVDKTHAEFAEYAQHWKNPKPPPEVITPSTLTQEPHVDYLGRRAHDLYIIDECDVLMNHEGSATKRLDRDIVDRGVPVVCLTGPGTRLEIQNFSHFITWALGSGAPVPLDIDELDAWGMALNAKSYRKKPYGVGELLGLIELTADEIKDALPAGYERLSQLTEARVKFRKRLQLTPGIVIVDDEQCDQPLTIQLHRAPEDPVLNQHFDKLRTLQRAPNGLNVADPLMYYQCDAQLGCGMALELVPRPPEGWYDAHREWAKFCLRKIRRTHTNPRESPTRKPLDTELAVARAYPEADEWLAWKEWKDAIDYESVPNWLSGSTIDWAAAWSREHVGLVWCKYNAVGEALAEVTGLDYYGAGGLNAHGKPIERADPRRSAILSIDANLRGRNLQAFNRNLVLGWPQSARYAEQLLGRTHRYMQKRPVHVDVLLTSGLTQYAFDMSIREAEFVLITQGQRQKLLRAGIRGATSKGMARRWAEKDAL